MNKKILIVDDENINRVIYEDKLISLGYNVLTAKSGDEAIDIVKKESFDVILLDLMMPEMDGIETFKCFQCIEKNKNTPVIFISAANDSNKILEALELGAFDFVKKPVDDIEFKARIKSALILKDKADQLQKQIELRDEAISIISHDLRGPLSSILNYIYIYDKNYENNEFLNSIYKMIKSTVDITNKLLDYSFLNSGKLKIGIENINIKEFLKLKMHIFVIKTKEKGQVIRTSFEDNIIIQTDQVLFSLIVENIVFNAIKYTKNFGEIIIKLEQDNKIIKLTVEDNGVGIKKEVLDNIFNLDVRKITYGTNKEKGIGLGLKSVKKIIDLLGFDILIQSEKGKGTKVIIKIDQVKKGR